MIPPKPIDAMPFKYPELFTERDVDAWMLASEIGDTALLRLEMIPVPPAWADRSFLIGTDEGRWTIRRTE